MFDHEDQIGFLIVMVILVVLVLSIRKYLQYKKKLFQLSLQQRRANQQEDVYNISSRVPSQWPTHDAHVSLDHFTIANEYNKYNDEPPTYEEAVRIAAQQSVVVPKTTTTTATVASATSASNQ